MSKSLLLTGSDGFTGQHFRAAACKLGYEVHDLKADLLNERDVAAELSGQSYDYVVHLAAISSVTHADELAFYKVNLFGTLNLLDALSSQASAPKKVLVASSANIYGNAASAPISEATPPAPINHYAMSKLAAEHLMANYRERLPLVTVRPFNYTGRGQDERFVIPKLVNHFTARKSCVELGNIAVRREFNDVRSVCAIYLNLLERGEEQAVYNVCSGNTYSLTEIIELLTELTGHSLEVKVNPEFVRQNEVHELYGDPQRLESCLGTLDFHKLDNTLQWMVGNDP